MIVLESLHTETLLQPMSSQTNPNLNYFHKEKIKGISLKTPKVVQEVGRQETVKKKNKV